MTFSFSPWSLENILIWGRRTKQYEVMWVCNISETGTTVVFRDKSNPLTMQNLYSHSI